MGRAKSAKNIEIKPWLSANADNREGRFVQLGNSLLLSKRFHELTSGARFMYMCMTMESGGAREFIFPVSAAAKYGISQSSLERQIKELIAAHFISCIEQNQTIRKPNLYRFTVDWKRS